MSTVKGRNILCKMYSVDNYYTIFCAKTAELTINQDEIEMTSVNSGSSREYEAGMMNATLVCTGVTTRDNWNQKISIDYLMQKSIRRQTHDFVITMTDDDGGSTVIDFSAIIITTGFTRETNGYSSSNVTFRITGDVGFDEIILPPTPPVIEDFSDHWQTTNGLNYITGSSAIHGYELDSDTDEILEVGIEGTQYDLVNGTPTAGTRTCFYNTSNNRIIFPSDVIFDGSQTVFVMFKRTT